MGAIIGGLIGAGGSLLGGQSAKSNDLTGYKYLTQGGGSNFTNTASANGANASNAAAGTQATEASLLDGTGASTGANTAFNNYLGSTGYNFQLDQGTRALTGSAAAKGILNSGSTAKALEGYGQNLGASYFNNYLGQLGNLNGQQTNSATQGQNAVSAAAQAGTQGGVAAGTAMNQGIAGAAGVAGGTVANNYPTISNFFGSLI